jgi:monoterpene epsilon-lactone hydrolase
MGLRLTALNLWLRLTVKRKLARVKTPQLMRQQMERDALRYFVMPGDANFFTDVMRRDGAPRHVGMIDALWASRGRPDRRKVILYLHGGAYLAGSPRTHRHLAAVLAGSAGVRAVLPDYRLAPESPFPAAVEDALASFRHLLDAGYAASEVAFAGDSAGGGLCFAASLAAAEAGLPQPACIVAFSPWVDLTGQAESHRRNAARDVMLPARRLDEVVDYYVDPADRTNPKASPLFGDWTAPPPTLIMASRSEILADDATRMAERLRSCGGDVQLEMWRNLPHAWPIFTGRLAEADQALSGAGAFIARHLEADPAAFWGGIGSRDGVRDP